MTAQLTVEGLALGYDDFTVLHDVSFSVAERSIFFVMGGSGSGKSTLLRALIGLLAPSAGRVFFGGEDFLAQDELHREHTLRRLGVLYQGSGLFSSMTVAENVGLPLAEFGHLSPADVREVAALKLALVGLGGFEDFYPGQLSGGMQKRAGLARALALDPEILFLDEPSAGLDPISARHLDELIVELRDGLGATFVIVSHELASIVGIGDDSVFLDAGTRSVGAHGRPSALLAAPPNARIAQFLHRESEPQGETHG